MIKISISCSEATTRKSEKKRRITERVTEPALARRRSPHKPSRNSVTTGFTSFPYRDKERLLADKSDDTVEKLRLEVELQYLISH